LTLGTTQVSSLTARIAGKTFNSINSVLIYSKQIFKENKRMDYVVFQASLQFVIE